MERIMDLHRLSRVTIFVGLLSGIAWAETLRPLDKIELGLAQYPPHLGEDATRADLFEALDAWIYAPDVVYWDRNPETSNVDFHQYYLRQIQKALDEAASTSVESGAVIWKLYSSGFLVKTPSTTFSFDATEGPFKDIKRSPAAVLDYLFKWTPAMREQFADLVDIAFVSHRHYDHFSFALTESLAKAGKQIIVPEEIKEVLKKTSFYDRIVTLDAGKDHTFSALPVRVFDGVQYMGRDENNDFAVSKHDAENNVYLVKVGDGPTFLHNGDNRGRPFTPWLREAIKDGWTVDVWFHIMGWPRSVTEDVDTLVKPLIIKGHEHELGHRPNGHVNKLGDIYRHLLPRIRARRALIMTWGERFEVNEWRGDGTSTSAKSL